MCASSSIPTPDKANSDTPGDAPADAELVVRRETVWHYPMPLGAFGSLGYRSGYGFDHVKTELWDERGGEGEPARLSKRFAYRYRLPRSDQSGAKVVWAKPAWADSVPYNAQVLRAAVLAGDDIWVTEGEADADALSALGLIATSSHRGAEGWTEPMAEWFGGFRSGRVTICADADPTGAYVAAKTYRLLADSGVYPSALRVVLPAAGVGQVERGGALGADVRDHLAAGHSVKDFVEADISYVCDVAQRWSGAVGTRAGGSGPYAHGGDRGDDGGELRVLLERFGWNVIKV